MTQRPGDRIRAPARKFSGHEGGRRPPASAPYPHPTRHLHPHGQPLRRVVGWLLRHHLDAPGAGGHCTAPETFLRRVLGALPAGPPGARGRAPAAMSRRPPSSPRTAARPRAVPPGAVVGSARLRHLLRRPGPRGRLHGRADSFSYAVRRPAAGAARARAGWVVADMKEGRRPPASAPLPSSHPCASRSPPSGPPSAVVGGCPSPTPRRRRGAAEGCTGSERSLVTVRQSPRQGGPAGVSRAADGPSGSARRGRPGRARRAARWR